ncbi:MAG TPA: MFS transporter [Chloroflexia bacterium]|nr:MFS transporter [Chloroflexia bacterium]
MSQATAVEAPLNAPAAVTPRAGWHLAIVAAGVLLAALDQTVVVTVLYKVQEEYQVAPIHLDQLGWVVTAYLLGYTVTLPLMGRVADVFGRRRVYLGCLALFLIGSVLAAESQTLEWLVASRVVQAIGGGALLPVSMAMVRGWYGEGRRAFALGLLGAAAEGGGVLGPLWGAAIIALADSHIVPLVTDWRWIFWLNLPIGAVLAILVWRTPAHTRYPGRVDWIGAGLLGGALLALTLGLSSSSSNSALAGLGGFESGADAASPIWQTPALLAGAVVLTIAFLAWERRTAVPLLPPGLFRRRPFAMAHVLTGMVGMALITAMVNIPLLVASVLNGGAVEGGLLLLRLTLLIPVGAVVGGALAERLGYRTVAATGMLLTALGFWLMSSWHVDTDGLLMTLHLALAGFGFGLVIAPITSTTLAWVDEDQAGVASALVNTARMVGMMVGLSALSAWALELFKQLMANHPAPVAPLTGESQAAFDARVAEYPHILASASLQVYTLGFLAAAIVALLAILPALGLRRPGQERDATP